jgi:hypothetical protein
VIGDGRWMEGGKAGGEREMGGEENGVEIYDLILILVFLMLLRL